MGGAKEPGANSAQSAAKTANARALIKKYWIEGVGYSSARAESELNKRTAWSAAFVSYCVKMALRSSGDAARFNLSASHSVCIGLSLRNDFAGVTKPAFFGEPANTIGKVAPTMGDIVAWSRTANIANYENALSAARATQAPHSYFSHCDIVADVSAGKVAMIGGNVKDSVSKTTITLDADGCMPVRPFRYNSAGNIISGPFIVAPSIGKDNPSAECCATLTGVGSECRGLAIFSHGAPRHADSGLAVRTGFRDTLGVICLRSDPPHSF